MLEALMNEVGGGVTVGGGTFIGVSATGGIIGASGRGTTGVSKAGGFGGTCADATLSSFSWPFVK